MRRSKSGRILEKMVEGKRRIRRKKNQLGVSFLINYKPM